MLGHGRRLGTSKGIQCTITEDQGQWPRPDNFILSPDPAYLNNRLYPISAGFVSPPPLFSLLFCFVCFYHSLIYDQVQWTRKQITLHNHPKPTPRCMHRDFNPSIHQKHLVYDNISFNININNQYYNNNKKYKKKSNIS